MSGFSFKHVCIEAMAFHQPPHEFTSAAVEDRIAPLLKRLGIPFGTLEKLSGIKTRYMWPVEVAPSEVATVAAQQVLEELPFDRNMIGAVINCSVCRDFFEPATACLVHHNLKLPETALAFDITNACIGFSNGMLTLAGLIESGVIKAGLLVAGENVGRIVESNIKFVEQNQNITRDDLLKIVPTFTLGSGAVAFVLCHESIATKRHYIRAAMGRSASQYNELCSGNGDFYYRQGDVNPIMYTESTKLIASAAKVGARVWADFQQFTGWTMKDVNHIFCHQVGKQVNEAFYAEQGLDIDKEFTIYRKLGNMVSVALPAALTIGATEKPVQKGDKVLLTAYGSGLNCVFIGLEW